MGATGSSSSFLRGLGLDLQSSVDNQDTATARQWNNSHVVVKPESNSSVGAGLGLGLHTDGAASGLTNLMVGPPSFYGNKPTTLDLLGLGIGAGGASTAGFSALFTSLGGGLDVAAAASFGGVNSSAEESWKGSSESKPSSLL